MVDRASESYIFLLREVFHYQVPLLLRLIHYYDTMGIKFIVLSQKPNLNGIGRSGVKNKIHKNHLFYKKIEYIRFLGHTLYLQIGAKQIIDSLSPSLIIFESQVGGLLGWVLMMRYSCVSWQCGFEYRPSAFKSFFLRKYLGLFKYHLAYHSNAYNYCVRHGVDPRRVEIVFNSCETDEAKRVSKKEAKKNLADLGIQVENTKSVVLYVGAILEEKKIDVVCKALENSDEFTFLIVGDGDYLPTLKYKFRSENIKFLGQHLETAHLFFCVANIFVLPGTGGLALNEACFYGLPIISSYADGSADDLVINDYNGTRLDSSDPDDWLRTIKLITRNQKNLVSYSRNSRSIYLSNYQFDDFCNRVIAGINKSLTV